MYIIRRVAKTQPGKAWEVAGYLTKITQAYEEAGRNAAQVYVGGQGLPGVPNVHLVGRFLNNNHQSVDSTLESVA